MYIVLQVYQSRKDELSSVSDFITYQAVQGFLWNCAVFLVAFVCLSFYSTSVGESLVALTFIWIWSFSSLILSPSALFVFHSCLFTTLSLLSSRTFQFFPRFFHFFQFFPQKLKSPALYFALYRTLPVICTSGCLVVFHNKQVKRSWYSHNRERAMGFSLKTVGFSLKWLLFWMCKCLFACLRALSTWNEKSLPWAAHSLMRFSDFRPCGQGRAASK